MLEVALEPCGDLDDGPDGLPPGWLSASETVRWSAFGHPARRHAFLAGRSLARRLVAARLGASPDEMQLEVDEAGCSRVQARPDWAVSISHSSGWVACVLADEPVGIDIEGLRPRADLLALAATVHSPEQCRSLEALTEPARLLRFYESWTLKEAWLKARGRGLDFETMRRLDFVADGDAADAALIHLPQAALAMALVVQSDLALRLAALPSTLAGEAHLAWVPRRSRLASA